MPRRRSGFYPSAPSKGIWLAALIIGCLGILAHFTYIETLSQYNYLMLLIGYALLLLGTAFRGI
jgi:hypothetical protein